jgi:hypothetical protein
MQGHRPCCAACWPRACAARVSSVSRCGVQRRVGLGRRFVECEPDVLRLCLQPDDRLVSAGAPAGPRCLQWLCRVDSAPWREPTSAEVPARRRSRARAQVILATDGLWDVLEDQTAVDVALVRLPLTACLLWPVVGLDSRAQSALHVPLGHVGKPKGLLQGQSCEGCRAGRLRACEQAHKAAAQV